MAVELESHDLLVKRAVTQRVVGSVTTAASLASMAYGISLSAISPGAWWMFAGFVGLLTGPMIYASAGRDPNSRSGKEGRLRVDPENQSLTIWHGNKRIVLSDIGMDVVGAWVEEDFVGGTLVVETRDGTTVAARFREEQRGQVDDLLTALGADARVVVMRLAAAERAGRGCAGGCVTWALIIGAAPAVLFLMALVETLTNKPEPLYLLLFGIPAFLCLLAAWVSVRALTNTTLHVGADGVRIGRRFVAYGDLRGVSHVANGVLVETESGEHRIRCLGVQAAAAIRRVRQAQSRFLETDREGELNMLDRAERTVDQWRAALAKVLERSTYRSRALDKNDLLTVVENPRTSPERRAGAILALGPHVTDVERRRVRIASEACAEPHTRAVMEAALDEELHDLEQALRKTARSDPGG
jgi:hypothetical protein